MTGHERRPLLYAGWFAGSDPAFQKITALRKYH
jgi:hypothetical protein